MIATSTTTSDEGAGGPVADGGAGRAADASAEEVERDAGVGREDGGGGEAVGEDGEVEVGREHLGDGQGGRPGVEDDAAAAGQLVEGAGGDAALDVGEAAGAGGERRLDLEALDGDRAAVDPAEGAAALEGGEVAAHGLGGDPEGVGEGGDLDPAGTTCLGDDPLLPLRCVHRTPSSCVVSIVALSGS